MNHQPIQDIESEATAAVSTYKDITMDDDHTFGAGLLPYYAKKKWVDGREAFIEFYFKMSHTIFMTLCLILNSIIAVNSLWLYFNQFIGAENGIEALRTLLPEKLGFIASFFSYFYIALDHRPLFWLASLFFVYFCWCYSTITQPIKDKTGRKTYISYVSPRGRKGVFITSLVQIYFIYSGLFAWYMRGLSFDFFNQIQVTDQPNLKITSLAGLTNILNIVPVVICLIVSFLIIREFYKTPDIKDRFLEWTFGLISNQSFSLRSNACDVIVGYEKETNKPIVLVEIARYLHTLIVGSTGTGKSSTQLLPVIAQDLTRLARGKKLGVVVLEPKGDLIRDVESIAKKLKIDESLITIIDPTDPNSRMKINPLAGPMDTAANLWAGTLDALSGDQDKFFKDQQAEVATNYVMLGKIRHGHNFHFITHLQQMYSDPRFLADMTEEVRSWLDRAMANPNLTYEEQTVLNNYNLIAEYFETEVLQYVTFMDREGQQNPVLYPAGHKHQGRQVVNNKKDKFIAGSKKYVNDISLNPLLSNLFVAREGDIFVDIDAFLDKGGILLFNSALGELEELSLIFGQFIIRQFQSSVFRRPPQVDGYKRIPIFFNVDEFPLYINEAFERLLTLGRSYLVGTTTAIQSLGQIQAVKDGFERIIIGNSNNKFVFGRGELTDNKYFSEHFGEDYVLDESSNESTTPFSMPNQSVGIRHNVARTLQPRFTPTQIKELKFKHYIAEIVDAEGSIMKPVHAYGLFLDETNFLKKFASIGEIELKTRNYKPLNFTGSINQLKYLVNALNIDDNQNTQQSEEVNESNDAVEETVPAPVQAEKPVVAELAPVSEAEAGHSDFIEAHEDLIGFDATPIPSEKPSITEKIVEQELPVEEPIAEVTNEEDDDDLLFWPEPSEESTETQQDTVILTNEPDDELLATLSAAPLANEQTVAASIGEASISIPENLDSLLQTVQDNLIVNPTNTTETKEKVAASQEEKAIEQPSQVNKEPFTENFTSENQQPLEEATDDFDDLFSLVAIDRTPPNQSVLPKNDAKDVDAKATPIPVISDVKNDL